MRQLAEPQQGNDLVQEEPIRPRRPPLQRRRRRPPLQRRRRRPPPPPVIYIPDRPTKLDVVTGRGGCCRGLDPGKMRYWRLILAERSGYRQLDYAGKSAVAEAIYNYIIATGGRFLKIERETRKWYHLPQRECVIGLKCALREKYVPHALKGEPVGTPLPRLSPIVKFHE